MKKVAKVILYSICIIAIFSSVFTFFLNGRDFYRVNILGYRFSFVMSESMEPTIMTHALCLTDMVHKDYEVGDVVVYEHEQEGITMLICHRVTDILDDGTLKCKGDNNEIADPWTIEQKDVVGKIICYWNGFAKIYNAF